MTGTTQEVQRWLQQQPKNKKFEIKEYRSRRSLDANAYCWKLCDLIGKELSKDGTIITKDEVYQDSIIQIGKFTSEIWQEKEFEWKKKDWEQRGLGFLVEVVSRREKCVKVHCYYGSSSYDSREMSLLIGLLVQLAKDLDIETKPKAEIDSLLKSWR